MRKRGAFVCSNCEEEFADAPAMAVKRGRVFLSYGHDPACEEIVRRVERDLRSMGWDPWLDKKRIEFGNDWRSDITRGLQESEHVLAFLSEHSTRKPGVCRQEVAIALGPAKCHVYTVLVEPMAEWRPPLIISHRQWLDMHQWRDLVTSDPTAYEILYQESLAEIVRVLERNQPFAGEIEELNRWLDPIDCTADMIAAEVGFTGREWLLGGISEQSVALEHQSEAECPGEIERWRTGGSSNRVFLLAAEPGWGKSAVAARLAHEGRARVMAVHFCKYNRPNTLDPRPVLRSLAFQMATQLEEYRSLLVQRAREGLALAGLNAAELFHELFASQLAHVIEGGRGAHDRHLIVLDALDETLDERGRSELVNLVAGEFRKLPDWLGLLVTSRPENGVLRQLEQFGVHELQAGDACNMKDLEEYLRAWLNKLPIAPPGRDQAMRSIMSASAGNFLYVRQLQEAVLEGVMSAEQLVDAGTLPKGLASLFERWFQHRFPDLKAYDVQQRPLLAVMLAAREPLPLELAAAALGWGEDGPKVLDRLGALCVVDENGNASLFHKSLRDWLERPQNSGPDFSVSAAQGHRLIAATLRRAYLAWRDVGAPLTGGNIWASFGKIGSLYAMAHLPAHLAAAGLHTEYRETMADFSFAMRRAASGQIDSLIGDYRNFRIAPGAGTDDGLERWSARIAENEHLLRRGTPDWPAHRILLQIAVEGPEGNCLTRAAQSFVEAGKVTWPWMRRHGQADPARASACIQVFRAPPAPDREVQSQFRSLALASGQEHIVAGTRDGRILQLHKASGRITELHRKRGEVSCLVASPQGDQFASFSVNDGIFVWSKEPSLQWDTFMWPGARVRDMVFSSDGRYLACASSDGGVRVRVLEAKCWLPLGKLDRVSPPIEIDCGQGNIDSIDWAFEGGTLATVGQSGDVRLWRTTDGSCEAVITLDWAEDITAEARRLTSVALNNDGSMGIVGSISGILWVFNAQARHGARPLRGHSGPVYSVAITPCGRRAVSGGADKTVRLWNLAFEDELEAVFNGHDHRVTRTLIDQTGDIAYSASTDGTIRVWDRKIARASRSGTLGEAQYSPAAEICALSNGPGGSILVGYKNGQIRVFNAGGLSPEPTSLTHACEVWAVCKLDDDRRAASASWDGLVRIWNVANGQVEVEY